MKTHDLVTDLRLGQALHATWMRLCVDAFAQVISGIRARSPDLKKRFKGSHQDADDALKNSMSGQLSATQRAILIIVATKKMVLWNTLEALA